MREEPDVILSCGHWGNSLGALRVLGSKLGELLTWCDRCGDWKSWSEKKKPVSRRKPKGKDVLF